MMFRRATILEDGRPHVVPCYLHGTLLASALALLGFPTAMAACGSSSDADTSGERDAATNADGAASDATQDGGASQDGTASNDAPHAAADAADAWTACAIAPQGAPGQVDPAFHGALTQVVPEAGVIDIEGAILDAKGRLLAYGDDGRATVVRFLPDGSLDTSFGTHGLATIPLPTWMVRTGAAALDSSGRILLGGAVEESNSTTMDSFVVRLTPDGQIDTTFGVAGVAQFSPGGVGALLVDGPHIWVAGGVFVQGGTAYLRRLNDDGSLDDTVFHTDTAMPTYWSIARVEDGVLVGEGGAVLKFGLDGSPATSFGAGGAATLAGPDHDTLAKQLFVQHDGDVIVVGKSYDGATIWRIHPDGSPDTTFGDHGRTVLSLEDAMASAVLCDERIVVTNEYSLTTTGQGFLASYVGRDGTVARGIDDAGVFSWPVPSADAGLLTVASTIDPASGKVLFVRDDHAQRVWPTLLDPP